MRQRSLGEAFSNLGPFLKHYSTYARDYQTATEALQVEEYNALVLAASYVLIALSCWRCYYCGFACVRLAAISEAVSRLQSVPSVSGREARVPRVHSAAAAYRTHPEDTTVTTHLVVNAST